MGEGRCFVNIAAALRDVNHGRGTLSPSGVSKGGIMARAWTEARTDVVADLVARVDWLDRRADRLTPGDVASELEAVRRIAARHGIGPAITVVHALDSALARGEQGPLVHGWLAILRDAVGCGVNDARTCETYAAACTVRLNG